MFLTIAAACLAATGCRKKQRTPPPAAVPLPRIGDIERGIASWYGHPYHGRRAANGEVYDMRQLTAAHLTLPFGTIVDVRNLDNGRSVTVRITDRGPFIDGRIIDLSHEAARRIQMIGPGTAKVEVRIVDFGPAVDPGAGFGVQIAALADRTRAEILCNEMEKRFGEAQLVLRKGNTDLWRVVVGRKATQQEARDLAEQLRITHREAFIVRLDETD